MQQHHIKRGGDIAQAHRPQHAQLDRLRPKGRDVLNHRRDQRQDHCRHEANREEAEHPAPRRFGLGLDQRFRRTLPFQHREIERRDLPA